MSGAKWISSYYRKNFSVTDKANVGSLVLRLKRDDAAIVYLNGYEIKRDNFTAGLVVSGTTLATGSGDDGGNFYEFTLPIASLSPGTLVEGNNVLAVEVHQNSVSSSDIYFDLELKVIRNGTASYGGTSADRMGRVAEALYILSLSPEFALQN